MSTDEMTKNRFAYASLLALQSLSAAFLLWIVFPVFYSVLTNLGERQDIPLRTLLAILAATFILQASYWTRMRWVEVCPPFHSIFVSHLISFAARLSFLFGGVLFSTIFFRHLPETVSLPPLPEAIMRGGATLSVLFGLFCYSLELERLAKAIEDRPAFPSN